MNQDASGPSAILSNKEIMGDGFTCSTCKANYNYVFRFCPDCGKPHGANPERIKGISLELGAALNRYVDHHRETGGFLKAVLENDLAGAFGRADDENRRNLHEIVKYVWNELPSNSWGSKEKVKEWLDKPTTEA